MNDIMNGFNFDKYDYEKEMKTLNDKINITAEKILLLLKAETESKIEND